jgi:hypothetical protein
MDDFKLGDIVTMKTNKYHKDNYEFYPKMNIKGTILRVYVSDCLVKWEHGSTTREDEWFVDKNKIKKVQ